MSKKLAYGYQRLYYRGEVTQCNYDFDTEDIGFINVWQPLVYVRPYEEATAIWSKNEMWRMLSEDSSALAVFIANNAVLFKVRPNELYMYTHPGKDPEIFQPFTHQSFKPYTQVGFVRTCPEVKDARIAPYILCMDSKNRVSIGGAPPIQLADAIPCSDLTLYKELIDTDHTAVYLTASGIKFI